MKPGAQLYTLRNFLKTPESVEDSFAKLADIGFEAVQVSGIGADVAPETTAELAAKFGLEIAATHFNWSRFVAETDELIRIHKLWKCPHPAIGGLPGEYRSLDGIKKFAAELQPVAAKLAAAGMDFSYHNHAHELVHFDGKPWLDHLYGSIPADQLKAEIDVYWIAVGGGDPAGWIRKLGPRQPLVHFKDFTYVPDFQSKFAAVGDGNLNWDAIFSACEEVKAEWLLIEQDNCYDEDPFACLARSLKFIQARL